MIAIRLSAAWCLIGLLIAAAPVHAAVITVEFAGTLSNTNIPGIATGDSFSGSFTFENSSLISAELTFPPPPNISLGPVVPGPGVAFLFELIDGTGTDPDSLLIELTMVPGVPWPPGGNVTSWSILLESSDGSALPYGPPPGIPGFDAWDSTSFSMRRDGTCNNEGCFADGTLNSFLASQGQSVPEPASLPLLIAALSMGLWFTARRRPLRI